MPAQYGELVAAVAGIVSWLYILVTQGTLLAIETLWILAIVLPLGAWALLMRLHFSRTRLGLTRSGHRVPIYVGRFKRGGEWGPLLIEAAAASGATIDERARSLLERAASDDSR